MTEGLLRHGWPVLVSVTLKSLVLLALAGVAALVLRRASAAARHLVWRLALIGLLLLPVLSLTLPGWQAPLWPRALSAPPAPAPSSPPARRAHGQRPHAVANLPVGRISHGAVLLCRRPWDPPRPRRPPCRGRCGRSASGSPGLS